MWNIKGINSREQYNVGGLDRRVARLSETKVRASGLTDKRLRLLASLEMLGSKLGNNGQSEHQTPEDKLAALKKMTCSELKENGFSSKFVRNVIRSDGSTVDDLNRFLNDFNGLVGDAGAPSKKTNLITETHKRINSRSKTDADRAKYAVRINNNLGVLGVNGVGGQLINQFAAAVAAYQQEKNISNYYISDKDGFSKDLEELERGLPNSLGKEEIKDLIDRLLALKGLNAKAAMGQLMERGTGSNFWLSNPQNNNDNHSLKLDAYDVGDKAALRDALALPDISKFKNGEQIEAIFKVLQEKYLASSILNAMKAVKNAEASTQPREADVFFGKLASSLSNRKDPAHVARLVNVGKAAAAPQAPAAAPQAPAAQQAVRSQSSSGRLDDAAAPQAAAEAMQQAQPSTDFPLPMTARDYYAKGASSKEQSPASVPIQKKN